MSHNGNHLYEFGDFSFDAEEKVLLRGGKPVQLTPKTLELLSVLVENRGRIVEKEKLMAEVWADSFVEDCNLTFTVRQLRKALGDDAREPTYIETIPRRGYRFVAAVRLAEARRDKINTENEESVSQLSANFAPPAKRPHSYSQNEIQNSPALVSLADWRHKANVANAEEFVGAPAPEKSDEKTPKLELVPPKPVPIGFDKPLTELSVKRLTSRRFLVWLGAGMILIAGFTAAILWVGEKKPDVLRQAKFTKLTTSGTVSNVAISPDAKYAVFTQKEETGESLWLRHLSSGSQTRILPAQPIEFTGLAVTPDGDFIYCSTFAENKAVNPPWRIPLLGGAVQELSNVSADVSVSFSPDGKRFAYTENFSSLKEKRLKIADADGSNQRTLLRAKAGERSLPVFKLNPVAWSPDGDAIACPIQSTDEKGSLTQIYLINPADGGEKLLSAQRWKRVEHLAWADAENLAFVAEEPDSSLGQIWMVSRRTGEARRLTNDLNDYWWIAVANGNLLSLQKTTVSSLQVADFDEQTEALEPRQILSESGLINNLAVAPDGAILYSSRASGRNEIWRVERDGAAPKQLTADAHIGYGLAVSPADGTIVFNSTRGDKGYLWLANSDGQNIRQLTEGGEDFSPSFTPNGKVVIYQHGHVQKTPSIWRVSTDGGEPPRKLYNETFAAQPTVSPDGTQTAFQFMDYQTGGAGLWRIGLVESESGEYVRKLNLPKPVTERRISWHPGGGFLTQVFFDTVGANFLLLPIDGGESRTISGLGKGKIGAFAWSPDGKQIAFSLQTETVDVVLLNDL